MSIEKTPIPITPGTGVMDVLGNAGYTFNFAIADIIDNCISAHAKNIHIFFDFNDKEPFLYILDDGDGMTLDELKASAIIGYKDINSTRRDDDLGRYSTGLKSATKSFCDDVIVCSKTKNTLSNAIEIDYAHIRESKKWEAFLINESLVANKIQENGTIIFCQRLKFSNDISLNKNVFEKIDSLEKSISHIFGKYLLNEKVKIYIQVNGSREVRINGWNPFGLIESKATKVIYDNPKKLKGETVHIKAYILPPFNNLSKKDQEYVEGRGLIEQEGFYVYRNGRLIQEGGWLSLDGMNLDPKCQYARIDVDIPSSLDSEFKINFSKNSLAIPDELLDSFIEVAKKARKESKMNYNYLKHPETKRTTKKEADKIWKSTKSNGSLVLSLNLDHPLIKKLSSKISEKELKKLCNLISKSLPVSMIQGQETTTVSYTENELLDLMNEMYSSLKSEGMDLVDIRKKMSSTEPFKDNKEILIQFFDDMEVKEND